MKGSSSNSSSDSHSHENLAAEAECSDEKDIQTKVACLRIDRKAVPNRGQLCVNLRQFVSQAKSGS